MAEAEAALVQRLVSNFHHDQPVSCGFRLASWLRAKHMRSFAPARIAIGAFVLDACELARYRRSRSIWIEVAARSGGLLRHFTLGLGWVPSSLSDLARPSWIV
jgi:hypothetical protein